MPYIPTPHQVDDSNDILSYQHAFVWADAGTGKTVTAMEAIRKGEYDKIVIAAPPIALQMWFDELNFHLQIPKHEMFILNKSYIPKGGRTGKGKKVTKPVIERKVIITTVDLIGKNADFINDFAKGRTSHVLDVNKLPNSVLILDEAHAFKNVESKRTIAVHGSRGGKGINSLGRSFSDVWQLTGTPSTRYPDDYFIQLAPYRQEVLKHHGVETYEKWVNEFCISQVKQYHDRMQPKRVVTGGKNVEKLRKVLTDCKVIQRKLGDVVDDLPPITYRVINVGYKNLEKMDIPTDPIRLAKELADPKSGMSKLRRKLGIAKASDIIDYVEEYGRRPTLIGVYHRDVGEGILEALSEFGKAALIYGGTPAKLRTEIIKAFNDKRIDFLVGQIQSMGTAANLQGACDHVILAEELISSAEFEQFIARVYRRGQKHHVQVDLMRSNHDLEEGMLGVRLRKEKLDTQIREG